MALFNRSTAPNVYGTALGADFAKGLVERLLEHYKGEPPEALSKLRLVLNTRRAARRVKEIFDQQGALLLPRISLVSDFQQLNPAHTFSSAASNIQRQLEIAPLILRLIEKDGTIPRSSLFELSASLNALLNEMHEENVTPNAVGELDPLNESEHWKRMLEFMQIVQRYFELGQEKPSTSANQRMMLEAIVSCWDATPPKDPIIIAGSTGSRGLTSELMQAVARLPNGAIILPGFDFDFARNVWPNLPEGAMSEDHPQYRFERFLNALALKPEDVKRWNDDCGACPERVDLLSLALRPAPVTDQWHNESHVAAKLLPEALKKVTLLEAPNQRLEALAIAMRLRMAAETGQRAALITPDRTLARQVSAALGRWDIRPDDSAGEPLHLTPLGRLIRQSAELLQPSAITAEAMIALLKHPLCQRANPERGNHLLFTRELELYIRKKGLPYPSPEKILAWAMANDNSKQLAWASWVAETIFPEVVEGERPLDEIVRSHVSLVEMLAKGQADKDALLWQRDDGLEARKIFDELASYKDYPIILNDYIRLIESLFSANEVRRDSARDHPFISIWGTLEARAMGVDLMILAGLNEGSWPEAPAPDPWLNRSMRARLGLLLPERRIGLAAHDFQQAASANEVWLSRSVRSDDAETVASRWVIRLTNLLNGLPDQQGTDALNEMKERGRRWLGRAQTIDNPETHIEPAKRPAPCPPLALRPRQLSVTNIQKLIRDPYAIYAKHVLNLSPLNPLQKMPDAMLRGNALHRVMELFMKRVQEGNLDLTREALSSLASEVLEEDVPFPAQRLLWLARFEKLIDAFLSDEAQRSEGRLSSHTEVDGKLDLNDIGFALTGKADRIDIFEDGLAIYDYKSGSIAKQKQREYFDKQLPLTAAMAEEGAFKDIAALHVNKLAYIGLGSSSGEEILGLEEHQTKKVLEDLRKLVCAYLDPEQGFLSRRAIEREEHIGDYDHLARYGEWSIEDEPKNEALK